jgi:hypothetical protein
MDILNIPTREYVEKDLIGSIVLVLKARDLFDDTLIKNIVKLLNMMLKNKGLFVHIIKIEKPLCMIEV